MKKKNNVIIGVISLLLVTLILLGLTYAYYKTKIIGNANEKSVSVISKLLAVTYQNESPFMEMENVILDYTETKTFEVKNIGDKTVKYSIMLDNVINNVAIKKGWTYVLKCGDIIIMEGIIPEVDTYIAKSESIDVGETKEYALIVKYNNLSNVDQSEDMGKSLSFRINLDEEKPNVFENMEESTLLYAIGRDNVVSKPLTIPGQQTTVLKYGEGTLSNKTRSESVSYQSYYLYGTGYTIDETTGLYTLTGVTTTTDTYASSYSELEGKYVAYYYNNWISASTKEDALKLTTSGLSRIYKITSATSSSYEYQTKDYAIALKSEEVLATTEDDYGTSYVYRGNVTNNYVNYSGMCWRIVRVQGDGTIKLTLADENGECNADTYSTENTTSAFVDGRTDISYKSSMAVNATDFPFEDSDIPAILSSWKTSKNLDTSKLVETEWCNDTALTSKTFYDSNYNVIDGSDISLIAHTELYYGAFDRLKNVSNAKPTLKCNTKGMEGSTGTEANAQRYKNVLGILSADEVAFAGSTSYKSGITYNYYLQTNASGNWYWTLSPCNLNADNLDSGVWGVYSTGVLSYRSVYSDYGSVRPAVVLASSVTITSSGDGTQTNPYVTD